MDEMKIRRISIEERESKMCAKDICGTGYGDDVRGLLASLPKTGAGVHLRAAVDAIVRSTRNRAVVIAGMGAHVVKCGLSPAIIDLIDRGVISCIAMNGAAAIHDSEMGLFGKTSEDVIAGLQNGTYGMTAETADFLNSTAQEAAAKDISVGHLLGERLSEASYSSISILAAARRKGIPVTLHIAIGTDFIHIHDSADGAAWGKCSMADFRVLNERMRDAVNGGVLINMGSAVILPEVYLKCFAILRNQGVSFADFTSINLDFMRQYRAMEQVVNRVTALGGKGISLTGHHEIMIPLLAGMVVSMLADEGDSSSAD